LGISNLDRGAQQLVDIFHFTSKEGISPFFNLLGIFLLGKFHGRQSGDSIYLDGLDGYPGCLDFLDSVWKVGKLGLATGFNLSQEKIGHGLEPGQVHCHINHGHRFSFLSSVQHGF
jgi:hypothetical protein